MSEKPPRYRSESTGTENESLRLHIEMLLAELGGSGTEEVLEHFRAWNEEAKSMPSYHHQLGHLAVALRYRRAATRTVLRAIVRREAARDKFKAAASEPLEEKMRRRAARERILYGTPSSRWKPPPSIQIPGFPHRRRMRQGSRPHKKVQQEGQHAREDGEGSNGKAAPDKSHDSGASEIAEEEWKEREDDNDDESDDGPEQDARLVQELIDATLDVVEKILLWRKQEIRYLGQALDSSPDSSTVRRHTRPSFEWRGEDYFLRMRGDCEDIFRHHRTRRGAAALLQAHGGLQRETERASSGGSGGSSSSRRMTIARGLDKEGHTHQGVMALILPSRLMCARGCAGGGGQPPFRILVSAFLEASRCFRRHIRDQCDDAGAESVFMDYPQVMRATGQGTGGDGGVGKQRTRIHRAFGIHDDVSPHRHPTAAADKSEWGQLWCTMSLEWLAAHLLARGPEAEAEMDIAEVNEVLLESEERFEQPASKEAPVTRKKKNGGNAHAKIDRDAKERRDRPKSAPGRRPFLNQPRSAVSKAPPRPHPPPSSSSSSPSSSRFAHTVPVARRTEDKKQAAPAAAAAAAPITAQLRTSVTKANRRVAAEAAAGHAVPPPQESSPSKGIRKKKNNRKRTVSFQSKMDEKKATQNAADDRHEGAQHKGAVEGAAKGTVEGSAGATVIEEGAARVHGHSDTIEADGGSGSGVVPPAEVVDEATDEETHREERPPVPEAAADGNTERADEREDGAGRNDFDTRIKSACQIRKEERQAATMARAVEIQRSTELGMAAATIIQKHARGYSARWRYVGMVTAAIVTRFDGREDVGPAKESGATREIAAPESNDMKDGWGEQDDLSNVAQENEDGDMTSSFAGSMTTFGTTEVENNTRQTDDDAPAYLDDDDEGHVIILGPAEDYEVKESSQEVQVNLDEERKRTSVAATSFSAPLETDSKDREEAESKGDDRIDVNNLVSIDPLSIVQTERAAAEEGAVVESGSDDRRLASLMKQTVSAIVLQSFVRMWRSSAWRNRRHRRRIHPSDDEHRNSDDRRGFVSGVGASGGLPCNAVSAMDEDVDPRDPDSSKEEQLSDDRGNSNADEEEHGHETREMRKEADECVDTQKDFFSESSGDISNDHCSAQQHFRDATANGSLREGIVIAEEERALTLSSSEGEDEDDEGQVELRGCGYSDDSHTEHDEEREGRAKSSMRMTVFKDQSIEVESSALLETVTATNKDEKDNERTLVEAVENSCRGNLIGESISDSAWDGRAKNLEETRESKRWLTFDHHDAALDSTTDLAEDFGHREELAPPLSSTPACAFGTSPLMEGGLDGNAESPEKSTSPLPPGLPPGSIVPWNVLLATMTLQRRFSAALLQARSRRRDDVSGAKVADSATAEMSDVGALPPGLPPRLAITSDSIKSIIRIQQAYRRRWKPRGKRRE